MERILTFRKKLETSEKYANFTRIVERFFESDLYLAILILITVAGFSFKLEIAAMAVLVCIISFAMAFVKDVTAVFISISYISIVPLGFYAASGKEFIALFCMTPLLLSAVIFRFIAYDAKYKKDKFFYSQLAYSIAVYLGGLGTITAANYFRIMPLYHVFGVGFLQLFFFFFFTAFLPKIDDKSVTRLAKSLVSICITLVLIYAILYIEKIPEFKEYGFNLIYEQYKNNFGNFLLLCMPACFYMATKGKNAAFYFITGIITYGVMLISLCRGAQLFGTIVFPFAVAYCLVKAVKKDRLTLSIILAFCSIAFITVLILYNDYIVAQLQQSVDAADSGRLKLYREAMRLFKENPLFGGGIGHDNPEVYAHPEKGIFYFHSTLFQLLGATGLVGFVSYAFVAYYRLKAVLRKDVFNIFVLFSFAGFLGYSLINTGTMSPFPFMMMVTFLTVFVDAYNKANTQPSDDADGYAAEIDYSVFV